VGIVKRELPPKSTLRQELVLCGKAKCKALHGPYWYGYFRGEGTSGRGGRLQKVYIGRKLPPEIVRRRMKEKRRQRGSAHDDRVLRELQLDWTEGDAD
jgi:hypothetical protein